MNELFEKIDAIAHNGRRYRHSFFQLQYFVIGKEPTIQAKIEACKRELIDRKDAIQSFNNGLEELYDKKRLEEIKIEELKESKESEDYQSERVNILIRQIQRRIKSFNFEIEDMTNRIAAKEDEANFLLGLYEKLNEIEKPKDWDSLEVQAEYWNARLTRLIESQLILGKSPNSEDFLTVLSLPDNMPIKVATKKLIQENKAAVEKKNIKQNNGS